MSFFDFLFLNDDKGRNKCFHRYCKNMDRCRDLTSRVLDLEVRVKELEIERTLREDPSKTIGDFKRLPADLDLIK